MSSSQTSFVVADLYQLPRINGKFSKENKVVLRKGMKVDPMYIERINSDSENNGKLFIIDVKASEAREEQQLINIKKREANAEIGKVSAKDLINALKGSVSGNKSEENPEEIALRAKYLELTGKEAKKNWKLETLKSEVDDAKNEVN